MDYLIAMHRIRPGAHYHTAKDASGVESYAALAAAFGNVQRGAAAANAALGYTMPSDVELIAAWQAHMTESTTLSSTDKTTRNQMRALFRSAAPTDLAEARQQITALKLALKYLAFRVSLIDAGDEA